MARGRNTRTAIVLSVLVLLASALALWSHRQVPDSVREDRRNKLLPALRRERITRLEFQGGGERFEVFKQSGRWYLAIGQRRYEADDTEIERLLTEAEFASPSRRLGSLDRQARERFGLVSPRMRVTLREDGPVFQSFAVGGLVADEPSAYVEVDGAGFVVTKTFADAFVQRAMDLRDKTLSQLEPSRLVRLEIEGDGGRRVLERRGAVWYLTSPNEGRVSRSRIETILNDLRDMRATRYLVDEADDATMARYGLSPPRWTVRAIREGNSTTYTWRFGAPCEGHDDEVTIARSDGRTVACVGRSVMDNLARPATELRDDKLVWARVDEVERVRVHTPTGEFTVQRQGDGWRLEGASGEADGEAVDGWLNALGSLTVETRLEASTAASHGLAPADTWIEIVRTGVDGSERLDIGRPDADRMYVSRPGEPWVLGLDPSTVENLRIDAARFRSRHIIRDVGDELVALITETAAFREEAQRIDGTWRLIHPIAALADPVVVRDVSQRLASLDAERWVSLSTQPHHGLSSPRLRMTARFEGNGPDDEHRDAGTTRNDSSADAGRPRVREYTLTVGANAPGGGFYASLEGRQGVFVLAQSVVDELSQPRLDRNVIESDRASVQRIEVTRTRANGGIERLAMHRDGEVWRTDQGGPVDRSRVNALLDRLTLVRAPRVFGYGPPPAEARLGEITLTLTLLPLPGPDAGVAMRSIRLVLGAPFGTADDGGVYARIDGLNATLSVPRELATALREFRP